MGEPSSSKRRDNRTFDSIDESLAHINNRFDTHFGQMEESVKIRDALLHTLVAAVIKHGTGFEALTTNTTASLSELRKMGTRGPNLLIPEYDGAKTADFVPWLSEFERKFAANNSPVARKAAAIAGFLSRHAQYIYQALNPTVHADYVELVKALKEKLRTQDRERFTRQRFEKLLHAPGQTVSEDSVAINGLTETALAFITDNYQRDIALRKRFMAGLQPYIRMELNIMAPKTFQAGLIAAERVESAKSSGPQALTDHIAQVTDQFV